MKPITIVPDEFASATKLLDGRTVLVIGANSDLGHAISRHLALQGAALILQASKKRNVSDLYDEIADIPGAKEPLIVEIDLDKAAEADLQILATGLAENLEALGSLVYLPAPSAPLSPFLHCTGDQLQSAFNEGVVRPARLLRALLPLLEQAPKPSVVLQTLAAGRNGRPYWSANGAGAAARENLVETLTTEHSGIRFNTIDFGKTASAQRHRAYPAEARSTLRECDDPASMAMVTYLVAGEASSAMRFVVPDMC